MDKKELIKEWLKKSEHDLGTAKIIFLNKPEYSDTICFHCQQAAEKSLKAIWIKYGIKIIKTHDLLYLLDKISEIEEVESRIYGYCEVLNDFSIEIRYPGEIIEPTKEEVMEAIEVTDKIMNFCADKLR